MVIEKGRDAMVAIGGSMVLVNIGEGCGREFRFERSARVCREHVQGKRGRENVEYVCERANDFMKLLLCGRHF